MMHTLIQKIHIEDNHSFACREYQTPQFETNWHKHEEYEIILITKGYGTVLLGDYVGEYKTGDVFFLASNLPHWFRKQHSKMVGAAIVLHFKKDIFGHVFFALPELKQLQYFLQKNDAIYLQKKLKPTITTLLKEVETAKGFTRLNLLLHIIQKLSSSNSYLVLTHNFSTENNHINPAIEKIIDYSFTHYLQPITLKQVAAIAGMTIPTFCRFFKKNIKKTYFDFLQELRIGHACKLLTSTATPILEICYESGYNSWAHFSKQFKVVKKITPSAYRREFLEKIK